MAPNDPIHIDHDRLLEQLPTDPKGLEALLAKISHGSLDDHGLRTSAALSPLRKSSLAASHSLLITRSPKFPALYEEAIRYVESIASRGSYKETGVLPAKMSVSHPKFILYVREDKMNLFDDKKWSNLKIEKLD